jgi:hypothetical protein
MNDLAANYGAIRRNANQVRLNEVTYAPGRSKLGSL